MKKLILPFVLISLLTGCESSQAPVEEGEFTVSDLLEQEAQTWDISETVESDHFLVENIVDVLATSISIGNVFEDGTTMIYVPNAMIIEGIPSAEDLVPQFENGDIPLQMFDANDEGFFSTVYCMETCEEAIIDHFIPYSDGTDLVNTFVLTGFSDEDITALLQELRFFSQNIDQCMAITRPSQETTTGSVTSFDCVDLFESR